MCFNPHPARRPGATAPPQGRHPRFDCFNPHPARRPGATRSTTPSSKSGFEKFQSSPGPKAGCYYLEVRPVAHPVGVSILTRPEGRVLQILGPPVPRRPRGFNPHPARRPGATGEARRPLRVFYAVSILTRPEGRVLRGRGGVRRVCRRVSILTRPEGRVLHAGAARVQHVLDGVSILTRPEGRVLQGARTSSVVRSPLFQSSPGPKAGCYRRPAHQARVRQGRFNPHPARRPGATSLRITDVRVQRLQVSILTRPEGRVLHPSSSASGALPPRFNPHPARRPGATPGLSSSGAPSSLFQSSPGPKAGCYS